MATKNTTTTTKPAPLTEADVRALRDRVFGEPCTDKNWNGCKDRWMTPESIAWLQSQPAAK